MRQAISFLVLCALAGPLHHASGHAQDPGTPSQRAAERIRQLQIEAGQLASREKSILAELRKLEIEREIRTEELTAIEKDQQKTRAQLAAANVRAAELRAYADTQRPDVEARLVRLYKMGRAGYWRLLLEKDDLQSIGRVYRTAAALTRIDTERIKQHQDTLAALAREQKMHEARTKEMADLQRRVSAARAAIDRAVAARTTLVESINARRDLTMQLTAELKEAQQRLQAAAAQAGGKPVNVVLPIRPFRGELPWPADGLVVGRFGRQRGIEGSLDIVRNGIELSLAQGKPVSAIHEGLVTFAGPFTGYGTLVIVDHGDGVQTLYGHLSSATVNKGDRVPALGRVGGSGRNPSGNPVVYFELRIDGKPVDPLQWLKRQQ